MTLQYYKFQDSDSTITEYRRATASQ